MTLPAAPWGRNLKDNGRSRVRIRKDYNFLFITLIIYMERENAQVLGMCLFYSHALQGTPVSPKALSHLFLLFVPKRHK